MLPLRYHCLLEDAWIELTGILQSLHWQPDALITWQDLIYNKSRPHLVCSNPYTVKRRYHILLKNVEMSLRPGLILHRHFQQPQNVFTSPSGCWKCLCTTSPGPRHNCTFVSRMWHGLFNVHPLPLAFLPPVYFTNGWWQHLLWPPQLLFSP